MPAPKKKFYGVEHATLNSMVGHAGNVKRIRPHIRDIQAEGHQIVGVESLGQRGPSRTREDRYHYRQLRYFYALRRLLQRAKIEPKVVEDPAAYQLHVWMTGSKTPADVERFQHYFKGINVQRQYIYIIAAINYLRTQLMLRNARKMGLNVIIAGLHHMDHVIHRKNTDYETIDVDRSVVGDIIDKDHVFNAKTVQLEEESYRKYGRTLMRMVRDIRNKKWNPD